MSGPPAPFESFAEIKFVVDGKSRFHPLDFCQQAVEAAKRLGCNVTLEVDGLKVPVYRVDGTANVLQRLKTLGYNGYGHEDMGPDRPLINLGDASVRRMINFARSRGYVTQAELDAVLPPGEFSRVQIEEVVKELRANGIEVRA